jgi:hypothetical protein
VRKQLHGINEFFAGFQAAFDAESHQAAEAALQIAPGCGWAGCSGSPG